jgi:hypothetical protein
VSISIKDCTYGSTLGCAAIAEAGGHGEPGLNSKQHNAELIRCINKQQETRGWLASRNLTPCYVQGRR